MVSEEVSAVQYDNEDIENTCNVIGTLWCKAEVPLNSEISVSLATPQAPPYFNVHPVVRTQGGISLQLMRFSPPTGIFPLCNYSGAKPQSLPIRGFYQFKEIAPGEVRIILQLKLMDNVENSFEHCEAVFPFTGRGEISSVEAQPVVGTVAMTADKKCLVWNIGQKFATKSREISLSVKSLKFAQRSATAAIAAPASTAPTAAAVTATAEIEGPSVKGTPGSIWSRTVDDDLFCTGANAYCRVRSYCTLVCRVVVVDLCLVVVVVVV
eukprot:TRINITY_DN1264_c0_g1_i4.p1 TRINITY_DN1264_c0_g1~~TRINITY_DN1264_c0_g1_i4.p1  ORF type:complete len:267 (-),score=65.51 TRINITY_DN1264_c0_g1_i4:384-1184(-)